MHVANMDPLRVAEDEAKQTVLSQQYTTSFHENKDVLMKDDTLKCETGELKSRPVIPSIIIWDDD